MIYRVISDNTINTYQVLSITHHADEPGNTPNHTYVVTKPDLETLPVEPCAPAF